MPKTEVRKQPDRKSANVLICKPLVEALQGHCMTWQREWQVILLVLHSVHPYIYISYLKLTKGKCSYLSVLTPNLHNSGIELRIILKQVLSLLDCNSLRLCN